MPEMLSKVGVLDERPMNMSRKHRAGASPESPSTVKNNNLEPFGIHLRCRQIPIIPIKWWQDVLFGPPPPRAPGARMT